MALPIIESTPSNGSAVQPGADHKAFNVKSLAAEAKARFGDNPTAPASVAAPATTPASSSASQPQVIPPPTQPSVAPRTSPSSREYLTPAQAAEPAQVIAAGQQAAPVVAGADPAQTAEQQILDIPDDAYVRLPVNGELQVMTGKEAKAQMMRAADYTRKTQELASQRRAIQPFVEAAQGDPRRAQELLQAANESPKLRTILSDPDMLERYLRATNHPVLSRLTQQSVVQAQPQAAPIVARPNPDELASLGEVEQVVGNRVQTVEQKIADAEARLKLAEENFAENAAKVVDKKLKFIHNAQEASRIKGQIASTITQAVDAHPVLKVIPNLQRDVVAEVKKMGPRDESEVLQATGIVLQAFLENAQSTFETEYQSKALAKQHVLAQGIEPPTGTSVSIQPSASFVDPRTGKFSFDKMRQVARGYHRS